MFLLTGIWSSQVIVPKQVNAVLGRNVTLDCTVEVDSNHTLIQTSWQRRLPTGSVTVAVYHPHVGISIPLEFSHRVYFRSPSSHDASIVLEKIVFFDDGVYTCKVTTFPLGITEASTTLTVLVEPKVYISAGSSALIDGGSETTVATCIAERGRPAAEVSWESNLFGHSDVQLYNEANGTSSRKARYLWQPTRHVQGHSLICVVRHPALQTDLRIPFKPNVQFAPDISVVGYDGDWYVGRNNVQMTCKANANPPAHHFRWIRLGRKMPEGVDVMKSTLLFLRPLQRNDSGVYRCEVANDVNRRSRDVRILIQDPPAMPSTSTISSSLVDNKSHVLPSFPTLQANPVGNVGSVVGGAVGGALFLLVLSLAGVLYFRKPYGTCCYKPYKVYRVHNDLRKLTQHELYPTKGSRQADHYQDEWGECPANGYTRAMRESTSSITAF
ncbi:hypothetical protein WMY93_031577 [Mugilogobius chulae]|uniref:Nectin cell adhesion molecule 3 n=1 Tax=Mugilogobius chulae TaxID=88201 RepID=A0AAW0MD60_9GOBI